MTGWMHRISRGVADFHTICAERCTHILRKYLHLCHLHELVFRYSRALRCPDSGGHSEGTLLLPRVYLQTVTLMQCNDYFYSRYFGSPFALSGMTPYWPTDYLCGCCHTWLLQLSSLFTIITSALPLSLLHLHLFLLPSVYLYPSTKFTSVLHLHFLVPLYATTPSSCPHLLFLPSFSQTLHL